MTLASGTKLGPYLITSPLGKGGMGEVYVAKDVRLEREVAIKILPEHLTKNEAALKRFEREAKTLAALSHPNILTIFDVGTQEDHSFVVMELLKGETLRERIKHSPPGCEYAIEIITAVTQGLVAAHSHGIIHRDLKPENIFITNDGRIKILDFGLAKRFDSEALQDRSDLETQSQSTMEGTVLGTAPYMSPEQARGENLDPKSDIFSTGIILYELLTGKLPFEGPSVSAIIHKIIYEDCVPPSKVNSELPKSIDPLVEHALEKQKGNRYSTTTEMLNDLKKYQDSIKSEALRTQSFLHRVRRPVMAIPAVGVLLLVGLFTYRIWKNQTQIRWAKDKALPEIEKLVDENWRDFTSAYALAEKAEKFIPNDPKLVELFSRCSMKININTDPTGANVFMKEYKTPETEWKFLGVSPIKKIRVPIGIFRWKMEKEGYDTVLAASTSFDADINAKSVLAPYDIIRVLDKKTIIPQGMVHVTGAKTSIGELKDFYIDRYEVTNQQYKKFIDNGGYQNKKYWKQEFLKDGKVLTWEEAMSQFVDQTGQPGPATWEAGSYIDGQSEYPVSGVSWYEAAAYAEFAGKSLPTGTHWGLARGDATPLIIYPQVGGFAVFAPFSNFGGKSSVPVGSLPGITTYGAYDMAGNVREWCWNETWKGRLIRGGAWGDNTYMFDALSQAPPLDRSIKNGFRCAFYPDREKIPESAFAKVIPFQPRDFPKEKPVPDSIFQVYREQFSYDKIPIKARIESQKENPEGWILERINFDAPYSGEKIIASLFLPKNAVPPYQTVIYFPGGASYLKDSSKDIENYYEFPIFLSFIVKNGRAVLYPVYKGTFERREDALTLIGDGNTSYQFTEFLIQQVQDFKKCIDYLETRQDIDSKKIAYYGMSGGAWYGAIIPAVEQRIQASVLVAGGFNLNPVRPEVDQLNYLTHIKIPTLMLNGKYDTIFPYEASIKPMFDLLGTSQNQKVLKIYETDHIPPRNEFIKETLSWFDRYLGPVNKSKGE